LSENFDLMSSYNDETSKTTPSTNYQRNKYHTLNLPQQQSLNLNFGKLEKVSDFNAEFMENLEDFSPSWRKGIDEMNKSIIV
jgi:hypothetical protein